MLPILIISLEKREDRRIKLAKNLKRFGYEFTFVKAIDGSGLTYPYPRSGTGIRGCHESHLALWKALVNEKKDAIIMEDDCVLLEPLDPTLEKIKDRQEPLHFFGYSTFANKGFLETELDGIVLPTFPLATHCYLARYKYLAPLINEAEKREQVIDVITGKAGGTANKPMIAIQDAGFSDVVGKVVNYQGLMK
jgi:GR25 family glycosyltransferase involved in LPS biosynthesis